MRNKKNHNTIIMKKLILSTFLLLLLAISANAQLMGEWRAYPYEIIVGAGTNVFLGDLGGGNDVGREHIASVKDIDFKTVRPTFQVGWRFRFAKNFAVKTAFAYATVNGADSLTSFAPRQYRNLSFKSNILELSTQLEVSLLTEARGGRNAMRNLGPLANVNLYAFGGVSGFYFNPKAQLSPGSPYIALQPLGTEGQGIGDNPDLYKRISVAFPLGFGMKYYLNSRMTFGLEVGARYTMTDYIDDVSGSYFDNDLIRTTYGDAAAEFADRRISETGTPATPAPSGTPFRGNPDNTDSYAFAMLYYSYTYQAYGSNFKIFKTYRPYLQAQNRRTAAVRRNQDKEAVRKSNRLDIIAGLGTMHYMGDLGGGNGEGANYLASVKDMDLPLTKPAFQIGARYRLHPRFSAKLAFSYGVISGSDAETEYMARQARNLSFKSNIVEVAATMECYLFYKSKGRTNMNYSGVYLFGGVGGYHFNPKAQASDGGWYDLQPLGTEGQGLNGTDFYKLTQLSIPMGLGIRYAVDLNWSVGLEINNRMLLTDYLDDVSGTYYNLAEIQTAYGDIAAELSDRRANPGGEGIRGNPEYNDSFFSVNVMLSYSIPMKF